ncbi:MAG: hypothetical protein AAFR38_08415 [Planctomycetota bacterium]
MQRPSTVNGRRLALALGAGLAMGPACGPALAQSEDPRAPELPEETSPVAPSKGATLDPVRRGLDTGIDWLAGVEREIGRDPSGSLLPERTFLARRRGHLLRVGDAIAFVPLASERNRAESAMRLMPSQELERIEAGFAPGQTAMPVLMSGQVFLFDGKNFLMPTASRRDPGGAMTIPAGPPTEPETGTDDEEAPPADPLAGVPLELRDDPAAADVIEELRERTAVVRSGGQLARGPRERRELGTVTTRPDNSPVAPRRGRVERLGDGLLTVTFDSAAGAGEEDETEPLTLLPCLTTERLAELSEVTGRTPPLLISGRLFSYQGREYLLPTMFQLERERGVGRVR